MTKIALCFTGQARTVESIARKHIHLIETFRNKFDTYVVGLTDNTSTYASNSDVNNLGIGHYDISEPLPADAIRSMNLDRLEITDDSEWNKAIGDFKISMGDVTSEEHITQLFAQFWKYRKITSLIPNYDIYIKLRWDVKYDDCSVEQMINNVFAIMDKEKYTIPPMAEVFVSGLYVDPRKGLRFQDYSPIYTTNKAQKHFNKNIIDVLRHHIVEDCNKDLSDFDIIKVWTTAFVSAEHDIVLYNVPHNKTYVDSIIRPRWYEELAAKETWHLDD